MGFVDEWKDILQYSEEIEIIRKRRRDAFLLSLTCAPLFLIVIFVQLWWDLGDTIFIIFYLGMGVGALAGLRFVTSTCPRCGKNIIGGRDLTGWTENWSEPWLGSCWHCDLPFV